ncbi:hypothetical protein ACOSP7_010510 [Xanthoceras sorbifolium]
MTGQGVKQFDNWKLSVTFSWNGQRHIIISDGELVIVFKTFDSHSKDIVEFKMSLEPVAVEYPEEHIGLLTFNNKTPPASLNNEVPPASPNNEAPLATIEESDNDEDD